MTIRYILRPTTVSTNSNYIIFLKSMKNDGEIYDTVISRLINECRNVIDTVNGDISYPRDVFTIKLSDETRSALDRIAMNRRTNRSKVLRQLIQVRAKGLC